MSKPKQSGEAPLKETILVIDDDESVRRGLMWTLNSDYRVLEADSRTEAIKLLRQETVDVVVSDLHLPPRLEDISAGSRNYRSCPVQRSACAGCCDHGTGEERSPGSS